MIHIFGPQLKDKHITLRTDNSAVAHAINNQTSKSKPLMYLLRKLLVLLLRYNISFSSKHIPGTNNIIADKISRFQVTPTFLTQYGLDKHPTPIPLHLKPENFDVSCLDS